MALTIKQHAYAGLWFMAAGIIPVLFSSLRAFSDGFPLDNSSVIWLVIIPLPVTGMSGFLLGAGILDSRRGKSGWRAAFRGLLVMITAFLSYCVLLSIWVASDAAETTKTRWFIQTLLTVLWIGSVYGGWVIAGTGMLAGWLLYQRQASKPDKTGSG